MQRVFIRALTYLNRHPAGDVFEVSEREAKMLVYTKRAELVSGQAPPPSKPPRTPPPSQPPRTPPPPKQPPPVPEPAARGEYQQQAITDAESASVEELRSQYRRKFGQEPDGRWGVPRLTQELGG